MNFIRIHYMYQVGIYIHIYRLCFLLRISKLRSFKMSALEIDDIFQGGYTYGK